MKGNRYALIKNKQNQKKKKNPSIYTFGKIIKYIKILSMKIIITLFKHWYNNQSGSLINGHCRVSIVRYLLLV